MSRVRVFIASSLDGFIAGPDDDLSWLPQDLDESKSDPGAIGYDAFMGDTGALLMGRRTYDVVRGFGGEWPYGETPVLVATTRELTPVSEHVTAVTGSIQAIVNQALEMAEGKDVYLDGGNLIRQALDANLVDEIILTLAPTILGAGIPLFTGAQRADLEFDKPRGYAGKMIQLIARPATRG